MGDGRIENAVFVYLDEEGVSTWDGKSPAGVVRPCALMCGKWPRGVRLLAAGGIALALMAVSLALMALTEAQEAHREAKRAYDLNYEVWTRQQEAR